MYCFKIPNCLLIIVLVKFKSKSFSWSIIPIVPILKLTFYSYQRDSLLGHDDPEDLSSDLDRACGRPATLPWSCRNLFNRCWSEFWVRAQSINKASNKTLTKFPSLLFILTLLRDWVYVGILCYFVLRMLSLFQFMNDIVIKYNLWEIIIIATEKTRWSFLQTLVIFSIYLLIIKPLKPFYLKKLFLYST